MDLKKMKIEYFRISKPKSETVTNFAAGSGLTCKEIQWNAQGDHKSVMAENKSQMSWLSNIYYTS